MRALGRKCKKILGSRNDGARNESLHIEASGKEQECLRNGMDMLHWSSVFAEG